MQLVPLLDTANRDHHLEVSAKVETEEQGAATVREWSAAHQGSSTHTHTHGGPVPSGTPENGLHVVPAAMECLPVDALLWTPPGKKLVQRCLSGWKRGDKQGQQFKKAPRGKWAEAHRAIKVAALRKLGKVRYEQVFSCRVAGFCNCGHKDVKIRQLAASFSSSCNISTGDLKGRTPGGYLRSFAPALRASKSAWMLTKTS